jgi:hypothetical protein
MIRIPDAICSLFTTRKCLATGTRTSFSGDEEKAEISNPFCVSMLKTVRSGPIAKPFATERSGVQLEKAHQSFVEPSGYSEDKFPSTPRQMEKL